MASLLEQAWYLLSLVLQATQQVLVSSSSLLVYVLYRLKGEDGHGHGVGRHDSETEFQCI